MRILAVGLSLVAAFGSLTTAFAPASSLRSNPRRRQLASPFGLAANENDKGASTISNTICDIPTDISSPVRLVDQPQGARRLRHLTLSSADGTSLTLGDCMGDGTSVVVFLRHLG